MSQKYVKRIKKRKGSKKKKLIKNINKMTLEINPLTQRLLTVILLRTLNSKENKKEKKMKNNEV